jgi:ketosteroid isomerase-like protein
VVPAHDVRCLPFAGDGGNVAFSEWSRAMHRHLPLVLLCCCTLWPALPVAAQAPEPVHGLSEAECQVWARELGFARSVAEHDAAVFAEHVHPQAAFNSGAPQPLRGREAIVAAWADIIAGKGLKLSWYPERVTIGGPGDVAWSSGPALFEDLTPGAKQRWSIGAFHSVWHRDDEGRWRVLFDQGAGRAPADDAAVEAFHAGRRERCPAA